MKKLSILLSLLLVLSAFAGADVYIKSKTHTDAFAVMGQSQPAKDETTEQWLGDEKFAAITPAITIIVDLKKNMLYWVNNGNKTYVESPLPFDFTKIIDAQMAQMMSQMMKMTVTVTPNGQTKTIGQWKCSGYDVALNMMMMPMNMSVWASTDVPFDVEQFMKLYTNVIKATMRLDDAAVQEMMKVKGYWIATDMNAEIMGAKMHSTTEVVEISKKTPDASVYTVPAGYTKKDKLSMEEMQQR
ncbi:MAG TPA: DUF4412 domain-containing protein [Candidatus Desulfaltia sp.]|nr:DUF4412 domain-containing protein [Candidatus Desulfaltia sp.]